MNVYHEDISGGSVALGGQLSFTIGRKDTNRNFSRLFFTFSVYFQYPCL